MKTMNRYVCALTPARRRHPSPPWPESSIYKNKMAVLFPLLTRVSTNPAHCAMIGYIRGIKPVQRGPVGHCAGAGVCDTPDSTCLIFGQVWHRSMDILYESRKETELKSFACGRSNRCVFHPSIHPLSNLHNPYQAAGGTGAYLSSHLG